MEGNNGGINNDDPPDLVVGPLGLTQGRYVVMAKVVLTRGGIGTSNLTCWLKRNDTLNSNETLDALDVSVPSGRSLPVSLMSTVEVQAAAAGITVICETDSEGPVQSSDGQLIAIEVMTLQ